jgi:putative ABC transport system substrate-binding protein
MHRIRRRDFITVLGGAATLPVAARGQQPQRMRRIGVLMNIPADDPQAQLFLAVFQQGLQELGWTVGRNLRIDHRWGPSSDQRVRENAAELVALTPDVILWAGGVGGDTARQVSRTVPVVLAQSIDPVGSGIVASLSRPGRNITGFTQFEFSLGGKWLQLLKEIAPRITRVGVLRTTGPAGIGQWAVIQAAAETIGVECTPLFLDNSSEIERGIAEFERGGNAGLIVSLNSLVTTHRQTIVASAARHRLPAVFSQRSKPLTICPGRALNSFRSMGASHFRSAWRGPYVRRVRWTLEPRRER